MDNDEISQLKAQLAAANVKNSELTKENGRLKNRLGKALLDADLSWKTDHAVVDGKWYGLAAPPMRADAVLDAVKKGYMEQDATALVITRHE